LAKSGVRLPATEKMPISTLRISECSSVFEPVLQT
jgi:hypothetical protein